MKTFGQRGAPMAWWTTRRLHREICRRVADVPRHHDVAASHPAIEVYCGPVGESAVTQSGLVLQLSEASKNFPVGLAVHAQTRSYRS